MDNHRNGSSNRLAGRKEPNYNRAAGSTVSWLSLPVHSDFIGFGSMMDADSSLRKQLLDLLDGANAHMVFEHAAANFPIEAVNSEPPNSKHTPWRLLEHMRIAQWDILEFIRNPGHISPPWPEGYWPPKGKQASQEDWERTLQSFREDLQAMRTMVEDPKTDLFASLPHAEGYTVLREVLVLADHNAFHLGEFALMRQILGAWK